MSPTPARDFRDLVVWNKAMDMAVACNRLGTKLPASERYELCAQLKRACISVPSAIAEGNGRPSKREYSHYLVIARGSVHEIETLLEVCARLEYLKREELAETSKLLTEISRMLFVLRRNLLAGSPR